MGKALEAEPRSIKNGYSALVLVVPTKPLCFETFTEYLPLGRFAVDHIKQTVTVGVIEAVTPKQPDCCCQEVNDLMSVCLGGSR